MNKQHPYMTRDFWVEELKNFKDNPAFSDHGNQIKKDLICKIINDSFAKEDKIFK